MQFINRLTNWLSRTGRDENQLERALDLAKDKQPTEALEVYNDLLTSPGISPSIRARALFNRALSHSSLKNDSRAVIDLKQLLSLPAIPENIRTAARNQLARLASRKSN
jgi:hypothetical protein